MTKAAPHWRRPDRAALRVYVVHAARLAFLFTIGYGGANWLAARQAHPWHLFLTAELALPLVPAMIVPYLSINVLFLLPLFHLDDRELARLGRRLTAATLLAIAIFLALPTQLGFTRVLPDGLFHPVFDLLYRVDGIGNCLPSLHLTYATVILEALAHDASLRARSLYAGWLATIAVSVVLVHQHHLLDVASGLLLAVAICYSPRDAATTGQSPSKVRSA
jgi:membrane-associated phospholipid phosphatase